MAIRQRPMLLLDVVAPTTSRKVLLRLWKKENLSLRENSGATQAACQPNGGLRSQQCAGEGIELPSGTTLHSSFFTRGLWSGYGAVCFRGLSQYCVHLWV